LSQKVFGGFFEGLPWAYVSGFSWGGSYLWKVEGEIDVPCCASAICVYSSFLFSSFHLFTFFHVGRRLNSSSVYRVSVLVLLSCVFFRPWYSAYNYCLLLVLLQLVMQDVFVFFHKRLSYQSSDRLLQLLSYFFVSSFLDSSLRLLTVRSSASFVRHGGGWQWYKLVVSNGGAYI